VSAVSASPAAEGSAPADPVRALQHALCRAAKADPGRRFHALRDKVFRRDVLWRAWVMVRANQGAPGIDKTTLADVEQYGVTRLLDELAAELREGRYRPLPTRRVFIPKPGTTEPRPLSIPAVRDRIVQAAGKIVLEPIFEADFKPCSFGFRPRRAAHDALQVLVDEAWRGRRWRSGVMQDGVVRREVIGTPQGGVISPLLANVHLHRHLGTAIAVAFARNPMTVASVAHDLNTFSRGRFVLGLGSQIKAHSRSERP
jgi:retron-type reverse transcriptase